MRELARSEGDVAFHEVEAELWKTVMGIGKALVVLFLTLRDEAVLGRLPAGRVEHLGRRYRRAPAIARNLGTLFGPVRYFRTYLREVTGEPRCEGFHPVDLSLGLCKDRFSLGVLSKSALLATQLSFAAARSTMKELVGYAPSTEVIEQAVLGLGKHTAAFFEQQPAPEDDGEVLVIHFDGKGIPTATELELERRRGRRRREKPETSPRHRGRRRRRRHPKRLRRKKGDKAKNARMGTAIVMYTLRRKGRRLEGPVNRWVHASLASKRQAFKIAQRHAARRGFGPDSGKLVQVLTDGDRDLEDRCREFFPAALHTIDYYHVVEYLWTAGECFFDEGSDELRSWVEAQKERLFADQPGAILDELRARLSAIPKTGPGNRGRRDRLTKALGYLDHRKDHIRYGSLRRRDLEISTGQVEGAVKHVVALRFDHGGMR